MGLPDREYGRSALSIVCSFASVDSDGGLQIDLVLCSQDVGADLQTFLHVWLGSGIDLTDKEKVIMCGAAVQQNWSITLMHRL